MLAAGDRAPLFVAPGTDGDIDLGAMLREGPVVLYFFPRALTSGCTMEAREFNQLLPEFEAWASRWWASRWIQSRGCRSSATSSISSSRSSGTYDRAIGTLYGTLKGDLTSFPRARHRARRQGRDHPARLPRGERPGSRGRGAGRDQEPSRPGRPVACEGGGCGPPRQRRVAGEPRGPSWGCV